MRIGQRSLTALVFQSPAQRSQVRGRQRLGAALERVRERADTRGIAVGNGPPQGLEVQGSLGAEDVEKASEQLRVPEVSFQSLECVTVEGGPRRRGARGRRPAPEDGVEGARVQRL